MMEWLVRPILTRSIAVIGSHDNDAIVVKVLGLEIAEEASQASIHLIQFVRDTI